MNTPLLPLVPPPEGLLRLPQALLEHLEQPEWGQAHLRLHFGSGKIYWGVSQNETDIVYAVTDLPAWLACTACSQMLEGRVLAYKTKTKTSGRGRARTELFAKWKDGVLLLQGQAPLLVAPSPLLAALQEAAALQAETIETGYLPWQLFEPPREWLYWPGYGLAALVPPQPDHEGTGEALLCVASTSVNTPAHAHTRTNTRTPAHSSGSGNGAGIQTGTCFAFDYPPELAPFFMDMIVVRLREEEEEEQEQEARILVVGRSIRGRGEEAHSYVLTPARLIPIPIPIPIPTSICSQDAVSGALHVAAAMQDVLAPLAEVQVNAPDFLAAGFEALAERFDYAPVDVCFFRHSVRFRTITTEETARLRQLDEEEALCIATAEEGDLSLLLEASTPYFEGNTPQKSGQDQDKVQGVLKASQIAAVLAPFAAAPLPIVIGMGRRTFFARSGQLFFIVPLCSCS
ncbi:hypothetical protein [Thermogemmatispora tikiterensis]|uniref:Uncharacterized protein n=1 Tax=Thermogemmatispora tikiterensis TaxID=1825093 RepID=A0A328VDZ9_9CHLR|nr:hypothetical protein [Thermogemmatispora tikiterensis]RAQ95978.1 hypothetical protein A4R35_10570 [Thermogemmatispora tikiterensis]